MRILVLLIPFTAERIVRTEGKNRLKLVTEGFSAFAIPSVAPQIAVLMSGIDRHRKVLLSCKFRLGKNALQKRHEDLALKLPVVALAVHVAHPARGEEAVDLSKLPAERFALFVQILGSDCTLGRIVERTGVRHQDKRVTVLLLEGLRKIHIHAKLALLGFRIAGKHNLAVDTE